jgi:hypothetical protein
MVAPLAGAQADAVAVGTTMATAMRASTIARGLRKLI